MNFYQRRPIKCLWVDMYTFLILLEKEVNLISTHTNTSSTQFYFHRCPFLQLKCVFFSVFVDQTCDCHNRRRKKEERDFSKRCFFQRYILQKRRKKSNSRALGCLHVYQCIRMLPFLTNFVNYCRFFQVLTSVKVW